MMRPLHIVSSETFSVDDSTPDGPDAVPHSWLARVSSDQPIYVSLDGPADNSGLLLHASESILLAIGAGVELSLLAVSTTANVSVAQVKLSAS